MNTDCELLSQSSIDALYAVAHDYYSKDHYNKAEECFRLLTLQRPKEIKHWLGLGASFKMQKSFQKALEAYALAWAIDEKSPWPHLEAAGCFIELKDLEGVKQACIEAEKRLTFLSKEDLAKANVKLEWVKNLSSHLTKHEATT